LKTITKIALLVVMIGASIVSSATDIPLNWLVYPQRHAIQPLAVAHLFLVGNELVVEVQIDDPQAQSLRSVRRAPDNFADNETTLVLFIDGAGTGKFARVFALNPQGGLMDGTYREGEEEEIQTGADFLWRGKASMNSKGWHASFHIPTSQLNVSPGTMPKVYISYASTGEKSAEYSSGNRREHGGCLLCAATPVPELASQSGKNDFEMTVSAYQIRSEQTGRDSVSQQEHPQQLSANVAWHVTPSLELRATLKPNFAEAEPDAPVLRFSQAFTQQQIERRQFFARSNELLKVQGISLVDSRRMAIPEWAVASEYREEGWRGAAFFARENAGGSLLLPGSYSNRSLTAPAANSTLIKGGWSSQSSDVDTLLTYRDYGLGRSNSVLALTGSQRWIGGYSGQTLLANSQTNACASPDGQQLLTCNLQSGHAAYLKFGRTQSLDAYAISYKEISPLFRSDLGAVTQTGVRGLNGFVYKRFESPVSGVDGMDIKTTVLKNQDWQGQTISQQLNLTSNFDFVHPSWFFSTTALPFSQERLAQDTPLVSTRSLTGLFVFSPNVHLTRLAIQGTWGELPDYYHSQAGLGVMWVIQLTGAFTPIWSYDTSVQSYDTHVSNTSMAGLGYKDTVLQAKLNWQYDSLSRLRYVLVWNTSSAHDRDTITATSTRARALLWEHAPRRGFRATVGITQIYTQGSKNLEIITKLAYAF
jgi:hypothetical protein